MTGTGFWKPLRGRKPEAGQGRFSTTKLNWFGRLHFKFENFQNLMNDGRLLDTNMHFSIEELVKEGFKGTDQGNSDFVSQPRVGWFVAVFGT